MTRRGPGQSAFYVCTFADASTYIFRYLLTYATPAVACEHSRAMVIVKFWNSFRNERSTFVKVIDITEREKKYVQCVSSNRIPHYTTRYIRFPSVRMYLRSRVLDATCPRGDVDSGATRPCGSKEKTFRISAAFLTRTLER